MCIRDSHTSANSKGDNIPSKNKTEDQAILEQPSSPVQSKTDVPAVQPSAANIPSVSTASLEQGVPVSVTAAAVGPIPPSSQAPAKSSTSSTTTPLPPVPESITAFTAVSPSVLSPKLFPEEPIPSRPVALGLSDAPNPSQPRLSLGTPVTPTPLTPTILTPLGEDLLDISDIGSLVDESEAMEGISQDVFESIEKLVNLDEQSTNATWK